MASIFIAYENLLYTKTRNEVRLPISFKRNEYETSITNQLLHTFELITDYTSLKTFKINLFFTVLRHFGVDEFESGDGFPV